uniref:14-3-3 domain-containing protein n=1 Tax=Arcella intermedia TaxID=1963864 RepID=A0A6B2LG36_9EUKA|eukprot:TRINITY_DN152_c0_g1_i27.p1 TRINITY_DN152_c0_g1~~TRINITY_DN152_c0_g1_i27.p1  ORF type:complete len:240 (-),score=73.43 TRINITY_DN152_c0_g1_i27:76-795(-)
MEESKEDCLFYCKLAEQCERYEEMLYYAKKMAAFEEFDVEQRNLFSVAYKNVVGAKRASLRILQSIINKQQQQETTHNYKITIAQNYFSEILKGMEVYALEVIQIIHDLLLPKASTNEAKVFYRKMESDYYRYLCEFCQDKEKKDLYYAQSLKATEEARKGVRDLHPCNPIRLGMELSWSVWYYEIMNEPQKALQIAKEAFDSAIERLDELEEEQYKDSTLIMQLLRDNMTLWDTKENA